MARGAADKEDQGDGGEPVKITFKNARVEEPLGGTACDVEEFAGVVDDVLEEDVAAAGVILDEYCVVVLSEAHPLITSTLNKN